MRAVREQFLQLYLCNYETCLFGRSVIWHYDYLHCALDWREQLFCSITQLLSSSADFRSVLSRSFSSGKSVQASVAFQLFMVTSADSGWCIMCIDLMYQLLTGASAIYIPMKLSHCSLESRKARPKQMASHQRESRGIYEMNRRRWRVHSETLLSREWDVWGMNWSHFWNCVWEHGSLLAACRSNDGKTTPPGATLNSLNSDPGITNELEHDRSSRFFSARTPFLCHSDEFQPPLSLEPSHHLWILVAEITPCSSFQHSFIVCISHSITSPNPRAVEEIMDHEKEGWMTMIADNGGVV